MKKETIDYIKLIILLIFSLWIGITCFVQRIKCTKMTETELFLNIPNSVILDFNKC